MLNKKLEKRRVKNNDCLPKTVLRKTYQKIYLTSIWYCVRLSAGPHIQYGKLPLWERELNVAIFDERAQF